MYIPTGKGMFIWKIKDCAGGDVQAIAQKANAAGIKWVAVKAVNGVSNYNLRWQLPVWVDDYIYALKMALDALGIELVLWGYIFGKDPAGEAQVTIKRIKQFGVRCYLVDVEKEYKVAGMAPKAETYMSALRKGVPGVSLGTCSYRYPKVHPELPWHIFLKYSDFHAPQVYWAGAHNPEQQLLQSVDQLRELERKLGLPRLPIVPVGAAYHEHGWQPTIKDIYEFDAAAQKMGLPGITWWEWGHAERYGFWDAVAAQVWGEPVPPVTPTPAPAFPDLANRIGALRLAMDEAQRELAAVDQHINGLVDAVSE